MRRKFLPWIELRKDELDWIYLSSCSTELSILEQNQDKINWKILSSNINALPLLEKNQDKIDWQRLSGNINAISDRKSTRLNSSHRH